jgi:hypothetical protein
MPLCGSTLEADCGQSTHTVKLRVRLLSAVIVFLLQNVRVMKEEKRTRIRGGARSASDTLIKQIRSCDRGWSEDCTEKIAERGDADAEPSARSPVRLDQTHGRTAALLRDADAIRCWSILILTFLTRRGCRGDPGRRSGHAGDDTCDIARNVD